MIWMSIIKKKQLKAEALLYISAFKPLQLYLKEIQKYELSDFHLFLSGAYHYSLN